MKKPRCGKPYDKYITYQDIMALKFVMGKSLTGILVRLRNRPVLLLRTPTDTIKMGFIVDAG